MEEVFQRHGPLADADDLVKGGAAGFVAHIRTVRQVVGAEFPDKKLVEISRFVGEFPGGIKRGFVRRGQTVEFFSGESERSSPADRFVAAGARLQNHRVGEPALLVQPEIGTAQQIGNAVLPGELRGNPCFGALVSNRLGPVLAEFRDFAVSIGTGPGAALAIKAIDFINFEQRFGAFDHAHISPDVPERLPDSRQPRGHLKSFAPVHRSGVVRRFRPGHRAIRGEVWIVCGVFVLVNVAHGRGIV